MLIRNILIIIPIIFYYLIESFFVAIFINVAWMFILQPQFTIQLSYLDWVSIIWIIKVILFSPVKNAIELSYLINMKKISEEYENEINK